MDAFNAIVSDVLPTINDALNTRGGEVTNKGLSLINRARSYIWGNRAWKLFLKEVELTLDSDKLASAPSDFGRVYKITSLSTVHKPVYSYNNSDENYRYTFENTLAIATGYAINFKFYGDTTTAYLRYLQGIPDVSENAHYLFFPANLVIKCALWLHASDKQPGSSKVQMFENAFDRLLKDFSFYYQNVDETQHFFQDDYLGVQIANDGITMMGD